MRICEKCGLEFEPSSGHLKCPKCRYPSMRIACACGRMMHPQSKQCSECRSVAREMNGAWKGGKTTHHAGYVMVRVPDHPRAQNNGGYVFEHILVMEDVLGRHLVPGETVHHLNGIKDDNRPQNLELWTRPQPSGIRARDALAWAMQTIAKYSDGATIRLRGAVIFGDSSNNASAD